MDKTQPGQKTDDVAFTGLEKPPAEAEASGRSRHRIFTCINCGAGNYYEPSWNAINCWSCGVPNWPDK